MNREELDIIHRALLATGEYMMEIGCNIDDRNYDEDMELLDKAIGIIWKEKVIK